MRVRIREALVIACGFALVQSASANPHVVGYERFHSEKPSAEGGAVLFSELGCANCHSAKGVSPAVSRSGPSLNDISDRVNRDWVVKFLKNPEDGRHGSTMPAMMHGVSESDLEAVVDYLGTLGKGLKLKASRHVNAERGSALYHEKGCVACHAPTADYRGPHGSGGELSASFDLAIAHPDLKQKTNLIALDYFLSNPTRYRPDGRMPHIQLDRQESIDIAAHLLDFQASDPREAEPIQPWPEVDKLRLEKGKSLVAEMKCIACHTVPGRKIEGGDLVALTGFKPAAETLSCISEAPKRGVPHYRLNENQRQSLLQFLKSSENPEAGSEVELTLTAMNCYACHERDGKGGTMPETNPFFVGEESLGDSGRIPPPLTGIGHKLQPGWMKGVFEGKPEHRVRDYVKTRMPAYPGHAEALADLFAKTDDKPEAKPLTVNPDEIEAGRKLLGIHGGVNCITCHNWGENRSLGIPAVDISSLDARLQPDWFREYLLNPADYRPGTLMPPLWPGGKSAIANVLDGDTERQIAAIWGFIAEGDGRPEGFPDRSGGQFELIPKDRPIIQRTFLNKAGTKAILVGFPGEIHIAYDGGNAQPVLVWRGRFFDAYNTWFTRAAPFEDPLSEDVYEFETSSEDKSGFRFRGYQIDESGNPTFLKSRGDLNVEESFRVENGTLIRTISRSGSGEAPAVTHPKGVEMKEGEKSEDSQTFIYSWK